MARVSIAVVGSLMMDLVVRVERLPALGETLFGREFGMFVGGKGGNQAIAAARLGATPVTMIGRVGADPFGDRVVATLEADGVDCRYLVRDGDVGTGIALPMVFDDGGNSIVSVPRANLALTIADVEAATAAIGSANALLLQLEVPGDANLAAARIAARAGVPILLNAAPVGELDLALVGMASVLIVNEVEAAALAPDTGADPVRQAMALLALGPEITIVTLGERGALLASAGSTEHIPAFAVTAVDSVGAGDAFCAAFAFALASSSSPRDAARFASAAGAISATRHGAAPSLPRGEEVKALLSNVREPLRGEPR